MNHKVKAYVSCLVLDAIFLAYFYIAILPFHPEQTTQYGELFLFMNGVAGVMIFKLRPIRMFDPMKHQLGIQNPEVVSTQSSVKYDSPFCQDCGMPTGKSKFCPNCGSPVNGIAPRQQVSQKIQENASEMKLIQVEIKGTAMIPEGQIQDINVTEVKRLKNPANEQLAETKPVRAKRVKSSAQPPIPPIDNSPYEQDIYDDKITVTK